MVVECALIITYRFCAIRNTCGREIKGRNIWWDYHKWIDGIANNKNPSFMDWWV